MRKTAFATVAFAAIGFWAAASVMADANVSVPAAMALEEVPAAIQLAQVSSDLPAQQRAAY